MHDNPCEPSPCGENSHCRIVNGNSACSCLPNNIGAPPNCRPECTLNSACPGNLACINKRCQDPCPGSCGFNARCSVHNHSPVCTCTNGYTGDPFSGCNPVPSKTMSFSHLLFNRKTKFICKLFNFMLNSFSK